MSFDHLCHPDRLFPIEENQRNVARKLYKEIENLPIISPHGHTDPTWFSKNQNFTKVSELLVSPDHYLFRMFYSQGFDLEEFGVGNSTLNDREIWHNFAKNFYLFRGTPSWMWMNHVFSEVFGLKEVLTDKNADQSYDVILNKIQTEEFKPCALLKKFNIEVLATTDHATDTLEDHLEIKDLSNRVIPTFRPDKATDPDHEEFRDEIQRLEETSGESCSTFEGYLKALRKRREFFKSRGATATDHGHPDAYTTWLSSAQVNDIYEKALNGKASTTEAREFRGHMLLEMAQMSLDDGLVMQIHSGVHRNHNKKVFERYGRDKGADVPTTSEFIQNLKPLLDRFGNEKNLKMILFTLDETTYSRELAPLAGHYPAIKLGPPWWFHDSPEGMRRYREQIIETAGFYNTVGFIDDTRAFFSIPARHDVARRMDCHLLSKWILEHRITESEALDVLIDMTYELPKRSFNL